MRGSLTPFIGSTLCIYNQQAGTRLSKKSLRSLNLNFNKHFGKVRLVSTSKIVEVEPALRRGISQGLNSVLAIGGDGTAHSLINALMKLKTELYPREMPTFGVLPMGTGCDWSRGIRQPLNMSRAISWLSNAKIQPVDIGEIRINRSIKYYLNIASCGFSGDVSGKIQSLQQKRAWSYFFITVKSVFGYQRPHFSIDIDGIRWFEGQAAMVACCNGSHFGRGMRIAPSARISDGWFDVILAERLKYLDLIRLVPSAYLGQNFGRGNLKQTRGKHIRIASNVPIQYEADGEADVTQILDITLHHHALNAFVH